MNLSDFIHSRRPTWQQLDALIGRAVTKRLASLSVGQARQLADLYRAASADLVQARTYGAGAEVTDYLESLVARGYALLYPAPKLGSIRSVAQFFADTFPRAVRQETRAFLLVVAAFLLGLCLGGLTTAYDPEAAALFVPAEHQLIRPRARVAQDEAAMRTGQRQLGAIGHAAFSSFLFTHNIRVSITCFAIGIAWGLPTLLLTGYHGVFIAALGVEYLRDGVGLFFFAWILPHGVVELTCMFLAGTAGLVLGRGVLWPRGQPRGQRVREEARQALVLLGGAAALLIPAGIIEGTFSQIHEPTLPYILKIGFAAVIGSLLYGYLWFLPLKERGKKTGTEARAKSRAETASTVLEGRALVVQTPELVQFTYPLAGPAERLCALTIDLVINLLLIVAAVMAIGRLGAVGMPVIFVAIFLIKWGYFIAFEWWWDGMTPGKQMMGIRVVQTGGVRCTAERVVLRNFLRVVDALPAAYALGGLVSLINRRGARLGDLAAGTVCIRTPRPLPPSTVAEIRTRYSSLREDSAARARIRQILSPKEASLVVSLALRRELLEAQPRIRAFARYAAYLRRRLRLTRYEGMIDEVLVSTIASVLLEEKVL